MHNRCKAMQTKRVEEMETPPLHDFHPQILSTKNYRYVKTTAIEIRANRKHAKSQKKIPCQIISSQNHMLFQTCTQLCSRILFKRAACLWSLVASSTGKLKNSDPTAPSMQSRIDYFSIKRSPFTKHCHIDFGSGH